MRSPCVSLCAVRSLLGFDTMDCGDIYTGVEELLGKFMQQQPLLPGNVSLKSNLLHHSQFVCLAPGSLSDLIGLLQARPVKVHTKFVPDRDLLPTLGLDHVREVIQRSLNRLGVPKLDLVQFHW